MRYLVCILISLFSVQFVPAQDFSVYSKHYFGHQGIPELVSGTLTIGFSGFSLIDVTCSPEACTASNAARLNPATGVSDSSKDRGNNILQIYNSPLTHYSPPTTHFRPCANNQLSRSGSVKALDQQLCSTPAYSEYLTTEPAFFKRR